MLLESMWTSFSSCNITFDFCSSSYLTRAMQVRLVERAFFRVSPEVSLHFQLA